jgi:hypothetical protein
MDKVIDMADSEVIPFFGLQSGHVASCFTRGADLTGRLSISLFQTEEQAEPPAVGGLAPAPLPTCAALVASRPPVVGDPG